MDTAVKKTVLITGATGFIGSNLTRELVKKKYDVHVLIQKKSDTWRINDIKDLINVHIGSLSKINSLKEIIKNIKPNYIFHLATYNNYHTINKIHQLINTNITGLLNLLEASKEINYKCFIVSGSSSEYGIKKAPMQETDTLDPVSFYAATKASATLLSQVFAKINNKPIYIFRLFSVYGPYEESKRFIPTAIKAGLLNTHLSLTSGKVKRDFIHVYDVVKAFLKAMDTSLPAGEILNIGTGKQYSNDEIVSALNLIFKTEIKLSKKTYIKRPWDTDFWIADNRKALKLLNWYPKYDLYEGLKQTVKWFKSQKNLYY